MHIRRWSWIGTLALGAIVAWSESASAFHTLREGLSDLLGPTAWGLYLILPVPYLLIGFIVYRIYRAYRQQQRAESRDPNPNGRVPGSHGKESDS